jgi:hypothetical protein
VRIAFRISVAPQSVNKLLLSLDQDNRASDVLATRAPLMFPALATAQPFAFTTRAKTRLTGRMAFEMTEVREKVVREHGAVEGAM